MTDSINLLGFLPLKVILNRSKSIWRTFVLLMIFSSFSSAATTQDWLPNNPKNTAVIDHNHWQMLLDKYLVSNHPSGVNLFDYKKVSSNDKQILKKYLSSLQAKDPRQYKQAVQKAYWINLYNALTVKLILDHYPVKSITKLGQKFFSFGPWDDDAAIVAGMTLSLNDIEHKILRPIFKDPRIHYAVNCASYSCPNLSSQAYTASNTEQLLNNGAHDYINHHRAVKVEGNDLLLSSIYDWYLIDFGDRPALLLKHLEQYAEVELNQKLMAFDLNTGDIDHHYDWQLNEVK
jgi:hypothetical protein